MSDDVELSRLLWYVLGGARGGENRARIIHELGQRPMNSNQLAEKLRVDYRTVTHHIGILRKNSLIVVQGDGYGAVYFLSPRLERSKTEFDQICRKLRIKLPSE